MRLRTARRSRRWRTTLVRAARMAGSTIVTTESTAAPTPNPATRASTRAGSAARETNSRKALALPSTWRETMKRNTASSAKIGACSTSSVTETRFPSCRKSRSTSVKLLTISTLPFCGKARRACSMTAM